MPEKRLVFLLTLLFLIIAIISFLFSPFFEIRNIEIERLRYINKNEIRGKLFPYYGRNLWLIRNSTIKNEIAKNNYVENVYINKRLPEKLRIEIQERIPQGQIRNNNQYLIFCKEGYILQYNQNKAEIVPEITGLGYKFDNSDKLVFSSDFEKIVQALTIIEENTRTYLNNINYKNGNIEITLDSEILVKAGQPEDLELKFQILESTLEKIESNNIEAESINLTVTNRPAIQVK